jgi:hypothetical protein
MTEVATRPQLERYDWDGTVERLPATQRQSQGERMREWLHLFNECRQAAEILARTSFVPKDMIGKPAEIATAMLKGWELGLDPLDALASIYVVHGRVGFYAEFMRRRMIQAGHMFRIVETNDSRCVVEGTRSDNGETHRAAFTAEQAKRAKIDIASYPAEKLVARATSRLVKQAFPDVLSGSLIVEDLLDGMIMVDSERVDAPDSIETQAASVRRTRATRTPKAAAPRPAPVIADDLLDDPIEQPSEIRSEPDTSQVTEPEEPPSQAQNRKMHALFRDAGITDRDDRLTLTSELLGFTINSSSAMTKSDANKVIDALENADDLSALCTGLLNRAVLKAEGVAVDAASDEPDDLLTQAETN